MEKPRINRKEIQYLDEVTLPLRCKMQSTPRTERSVRCTTGLGPTASKVLLGQPQGRSTAEFLSDWDFMGLYGCTCTLTPGEPI